MDVNNNFIIISLMVIFTLCLTLSSIIELNAEGQRQDFNVTINEIMIKLLFTSIFRNYNIYC